jgi:predicted nucleotidyltransferase
MTAFGGVIETELRSFFGSHPDGIVAVYLFGSVARGQERPDGDVDVAVLSCPGAPRHLRRAARGSRSGPVRQTPIPMTTFVRGYAEVDPLPAG